MAMSTSDIQTGWVYRTSHQQQRLVLGRDRDGRIVYVSKGRNPDAPFHNCHVRITAQKFAQRAIGKLHFIDDVTPYIVANKATTVVVRERSVRPASAPAAGSSAADAGVDAATQTAPATR